MEMPKPTAAHHELKRFAGAWEGQETIHPSPMDPKGGIAIGRVTNRSALDGFIIVQDYEQERDGRRCFSGHGVIGWDGFANCYTFHWWDSVDQPPQLYQGQRTGNVFTLTSQVPQGHSRAIFTFDGADPRNYHFRLEVSRNGTDWHPFMTGEYSKKG